MQIQNARIYGRFSSKPQERGDSKRRQIEGAKAYAAKNGMTIVAGPYFDEGVSGKAGLNLEREFGHLLKDAQEGEAVLCEELDRIGRQSPFVLGKLVYDLVQKGLTVIAWQEGKVINRDNIDTLETQFSVFTGAAVSHSDNTRKIRRLLDTTAQALGLAAKGIQSGTLVSYLPQCYRWNPDTKAIERDEAKAALIRRIFDMFNGGMGKTTICQTLNREGVGTLYNTNRTVKVWREPTIRKILLNESYAGTLRVKGQAFTCIPAVVSQATFDQAQLLLQRFSTRRGHTNGRVNNLFSGLAVCKHCGGSINVGCSQRKPNSTHCYNYRCKDARVHKCSHHNMLNAFTVEYLFFTYYFMGSPEQSFSNSTGELTGKIEAAQTKLNKLTAAISNLYDMAESGDTEAKDRIAKRKIEKMDIEKELRLFKGQIVERANFPAAAATVTHSLSDGMVIDARELPAKLANNEIRSKLRASLPSIFEKVIFDTTARTVEGILKEGVTLNTFFKDVTIIHIPKLSHTK